MPVEVAMWKLGEKVDRGSFEPTPPESWLKDVLARDISTADQRAAGESVAIRNPVRTVAGGVRS